MGDIAIKNKGRVINWASKIYFLLLVLVAITACVISIQFVASQAQAATVYGSWSGNKTTTTKPTESATLRVVSTHTKYTYFRYCNYYDNLWQQDSIPWGSSSTYHEVSFDSPMNANSNKFPDHGNKAWDIHGPYGSCSHKRAGQSYWWTKSIVTTYTYQTRSKIATSTTGALRGLVYDAKTNKCISSAAVKIYKKNGRLVKSCSSSSSGSYILANIKPGTYILKIKHGGYLLLKVTINVKKGQVSYCDNALLVKTYKGKGTAKGCIKNALTGKAKKGVILLIKKGWNNSAGKTIKRVKTNSSGWYCLKIKAGYYTAVCSAKGSASFHFNIIVRKGTASNQNASITPTVSKGKYRIVLTWEDEPRDLDSHLVSPKFGGSNYHILYYRKQLSGSKRKLANLDVDDRNGYGPETVTFTVNKKKSYTYYVRKYDGYGYLSQSNARVRLYKGSKLMASYHVPTNGSGDVWNVFKIVKGKIKTVNTLSWSPSGVSSAFAYEGDPDY